MAIKQGWSFGKEHGFTGSAGQTMVKGYARGGGVKGAEAGKGKLGPDLNVKFPGNHLAYKKGGFVNAKETDMDAKRGGPIHKAKGGMARPPGMPRAPVLGMKRTRHPPGMPGGMGNSMPQVPGLPAAGAAPMGVPGAPGSPPRVMAKGGKTRGC